LVAVVVRLILGNWRGIRAASASARYPLNALEFALGNPKTCQASFSRCVVSCLAGGELQSLQASMYVAVQVAPPFMDSRRRPL
jgi:hypothetical protein